MKKMSYKAPQITDFGTVAALTASMSAGSFFDNASVMDTEVLMAMSMMA